MAQVIIGNRVMKVQGVMLDTGEIIPFEMKLLAYIPKKVEREAYVKVFQDNILELINKKLSKTELSIFIWFINKTTWNNDWIYVDYDELAKEMELSTGYVKTVIPKLVRLNLLIQKAPRQKVFRLNPRYVYKGGVIGRREDIDF